MVAAKEKAQKGLALVEKAVLDFIAQNPNGVSNAEIATALSLESDISGKHRNYLSWSILGNLTNKGLVVKQGTQHRARYLLGKKVAGSDVSPGL